MMEKFSSIINVPLIMILITEDVSNILTKRYWLYEKCSYSENVSIYPARRCDELTWHLLQSQSSSSGEVGETLK